MERRVILCTLRGWERCWASLSGAAAREINKCITMRGYPGINCKMALMPTWDPDNLRNEWWVDEFKDILQKEPGRSFIRNPTAAVSKKNPQVLQDPTDCCETRRLEKHLKRSVKVCTGWAGHAQANIPTGESPCSSLALLQGPYRVLFRRNISLIKGCVKWTRPFLDMLVTRSLWSKMCKSMLSVGCFFFLSAHTDLCDAGQSKAARPKWWGALAARENRDPLRSPRREGKKHPTDAIWIQPIRTTVYSNKRASPPDDTPPPLKGAAAI